MNRKGQGKFPFLPLGNHLACHGDKKNKSKSSVFDQNGHDNTDRPGRLARAHDDPAQIEKQAAAFHGPVTG